MSQPDCNDALSERLERIGKKLIATTEFSQDAHAVLEAAAVLSEIVPQPDSEVLRLLREAIAALQWCGGALYFHGDASVIWKKGPAETMRRIRAFIARADKDNAAGQDALIGKPQSYSADEPAPAAPAALTEAPTPRTDALVEREKDLPDSSVSFVLLARSLERQHDAALSRERLLTEELVSANQFLTAARQDCERAEDRERLANERGENLHAKLREMESAVSASGAIQEITAERRRQIEKEGWSNEHDDGNSAMCLAVAGACYALYAASRDSGEGQVWRDRYAGAAYELWPWDEDWRKPKDTRRDLVRAAALIAAEIERIDRAALANGK